MLVRGTYQATDRAASGPRPLRATVAGSLAGKAAEMVTLVLLATVLPRVLGPVDYGHFAVPLTVVTLGSLAMTLGGPTLMARFVPAAPPGERVALARALGVRLARGRAAQLAVIAALACVAMLWAPDRFPLLLTSLVLAALALNVAASVGLQVGLGLGRTGAWSARYPLQNAVLVGAVLVLHEVAGTGGAVGALVVSALAAVGLAAGVVAPVLREPAAPVAVPPGAIRFGALQAAGAALVQVAHRGGVVAVAVLAGSPRETGYAALAIGIALGATYAVLQTFTVSLPHVAGSTATQGTDDGRTQVDDPPQGGVPIGVKNPEDCAGMPTSPGSLAFAGRGPVGDDSVHAARLRGVRRRGRRQAGSGPDRERVSHLGATTRVARLGSPGWLSLGGGTVAGRSGAVGDRAGLSLEGGTGMGSSGAVGDRVGLSPGGGTGARPSGHATGAAAGEAVLRRLAGGLLALLVPGAIVAAALVEVAVPAVVGPGFRDATAAFGPALALVVLAPLYALGVQVAALRLRPEAALANGLATAAAFVAVSLVAVPPWGAAGATGAALAGGLAGIAVSARALPGTFGGRLTAASLAGAAAVLVVAALA